MCNHERLRTVGNRVFCCFCKEELPLEFLLARNKPAEAEKQPEKAVSKEKTDKPTPKKGRPKKAV